jgi:hypothetical protein
LRAFHERLLRIQVPYTSEISSELSCKYSMHLAMYLRENAHRTSHQGGGSMGMKEVVWIVAFFIALLGPVGIGFLVPTRLLAGLLSAAWPVVIGIIMAITYGLPHESVGTWLGNIAVVTVAAAFEGTAAFNVKARRNKAK